MLNWINQNLSLFWMLQIIGWAGYTLDRYLSAEYNFLVPFIYLAVACALTFGLRPIYHRLWERKPSVLVVGLTIVGCSIIAAYLWLVIGELIFAATGIRRFPVPAQKSLIAYLSDTFRYSLQHHKPFLFLSWSALYFGIKYWQDKRKEEENALKAANLAQAAELKILRYQLNPHFLFNSLNSAGALVHESPTRAEQMLDQLSEFLRYSLINHKTNTVSLNEEVEAIKNYLNVEKVRFEEKLQVNFEIAGESENFRLPIFLLHPLVENAVKYGMKTSEMPLEIDFKTKIKDGVLQIEISNTGRWFDPADRPGVNSTGIGLENVRKRLETTFPKRHHFEIKQAHGKVLAKIEIYPK